MRYEWVKKKNIWDKSYWSKHGASVRRSYFKWEFLKFFNTPQWVEMKAFLHERLRLGYDICPSPKGRIYYQHMFRSLVETPFDRVRIVIVGQDPYYHEGLADGLVFSVRPNVKEIPRTLAHIFREYERDLGFKYPLTGDLTTWARRGILLMPSVWSIETQFDRYGHYKVNGKCIWRSLTFEIFQELSHRKDRLVFMLWGKKAQENRYIIDENKHLVLTAPHPTPRNITYTGDKDAPTFRGSRHFTKACDYLGISTNIWRLP